MAGVATGIRCGAQLQTPKVLKMTESFSHSFIPKGFPEPISGPSSSSHARHSSRSKIRNGMPSDLQNPRLQLSERDDSPPPALDGGRFGHSYSRDVTPPRTPDNLLTRVDSKASLVVNYLPSKFSSGVFADSNQGYYRRGRNLTDSWGSLKTGDGADTSRNDEADLAEDSSTYQWLHETNKKSKRKLRWNKFKWFLFFANLSLTVYSLVGLVFCLLTWFNTFRHADILRVGNRIELIISTLACCLGIFTSVIGWAGILLNNRSFLAVYTFLLWIVFIFILIPAYMTYKRRTFNLEGKINAQWSQALGLTGRLRIQNELGCCGYFSPFVEATVSQSCYARSILPGCKLAYMIFERIVLKTWYTAAFSLVPVHLAVMIVGLLCSNHVTNRFGKGMMPKAYRLSLTSMAMIMEGYANQLAEMYDADSASENFGTHPRSNRRVDGLASTQKRTQSSRPSSSRLGYTTSSRI